MANLKLNRKDVTKEESEVMPQIPPMEVAGYEPDNREEEDDSSKEDQKVEDDISRLLKGPRTGQQEAVKLSKKEIKKMGVKRKHPEFVILLAVFWLVVLAIWNPIHHPALDYAKKWAVQKAQSVTGATMAKFVKLDSSSFLETENDRFPDGNTCEYVTTVEDVNQRHLLVFETSHSMVGDDDILWTHIPIFFESFPMMHDGKEVNVQITTSTDTSSIPGYLMDYGNDKAMVVEFSGFEERGLYSMEMNVLYQSFLSLYVQDGSSFTLKEVTYAE